MKFDVGKAIELSKENLEPINVAELEKLVGHEIIALESHLVYVNKGILKEIGPTFHPRVPSYLYVPNNTRMSYSKSWLGVKFENAKYARNSLDNINILFSDGEYYSAHIGIISEHKQETFHEQKPCENCLIARADDWMTNHQKKTWGFDRFIGANHKEAAKFVLKKYPKAIARRFDAETVEDMKKLVKKL